MIQSALMDSSEQRLALKEFEAVAGTLARPELPPPPPPAKDLDDRALVAAAEAARRVIGHGDPFPTLAEPSLHNPARTAAELSERHRDLTERRAGLEIAVATKRAQLAATEGPIARRRHRHDREEWQRELWVCSRQVADIQLHLPVVEARLNNIRNDQLLLDDWYRRKAEAGWRWRELYDEAGVRIERRVQAAEAAPTVAGHSVPPPSLIAHGDWWLSAVEVQRSRLWEGEESTEAGAVEWSKRDETNVLASEARPDVASVLVGVDEAEVAAAGRQRQRDYDAEWATDPYASRYAARWQTPRLDHEHSFSPGPSLGP
jgi:hypothetical protein